ncbi:MAG: hypothetical protein ACP5MW_06560 [Thermoplasmata archaeon]
MDAIIGKFYFAVIGKNLTAVYNKTGRRGHRKDIIRFTFQYTIYR